MFNRYILEEFEACRNSYVQLDSAVTQVISEILHEENLKIHSVSHRIKDFDSLATKIAQPDKTYSCLDDITDLVGCRIITYFEDQIEQIAELVEQRFSVDLSRSIDKRKRNDPTSFGYRSLHYVCRLKADYPAEVQVRAIPFEIQIRTILQHAWAEIEHDLGYKTEEAVPGNIRRKFSRVAGLLEIADEEFVQVRHSLQKYATQVEEEIVNSPGRLELDKVSLQILLGQPLTTRLDEAIASALSRPLEPTAFYPEYLVKVLRRAGLGHVEILGRKLEEKQDMILDFLDPYMDFTKKAFSFGRNDLDRVSRGYSLLILAHLEVLRSASLDIDRIAQVSRFYQDVDRTPADLAERSALVLVQEYRSFMSGKSDSGKFELRQTN